MRWFRNEKWRGKMSRSKKKKKKRIKKKKGKKDEKRTRFCFHEVVATVNVAPCPRPAPVHHTTTTTTTDPRRRGVRVDLIYQYCAVVWVLRSSLQAGAVCDRCVLSF